MASYVAHSLSAAAAVSALLGLVYSIILMFTLVTKCSFTLLYR